MAQTMVLYMYRLMGEVLPAPDDANQALVDECARAFNVALVEVMNLTKTLSQMSCFKVRLDRQVLYSLVLIISRYRFIRCVRYLFTSVWRT